MRALFVIRIGLVLLLAGCSTTGGSEPDGGLRNSCSNGRRYDENTVFDLVPDESMTQAPTCLPRCGQPEKLQEGTNNTTADLPSGECTYYDEVCSASAVRLRVCPDSTECRYGYTPYACRCENGQWHCYESRNKGASICTCSADAGTRD
jgi:hypothetical protein